MKRWNIVAIVDGAEVKMVVRGTDKVQAETDAHKNYKGITRIIKIEERSSSKTFPTSTDALRNEPYTFELKNQTKAKRANRKTFYG